jgi:nitroreductase
MERRAQMARSMGDSFRRDLLSGGMEIRAAETQVWKSHDRILEAPVLLMLCCDAADVDLYNVERRSRGEETMGMQGVSLFGGMILLAAHAEGLGGVWVCAPLFAQREVQAALDLPASWQPQGMILLGYPTDSLQIHAERHRKSVSEFTKAI